MVVGDTPALRANCLMLSNAWSRASRKVTINALTTAGIRSWHVFTSYHIVSECSRKAVPVASM
jgi:hypothetical protein